MVDLKKVYRGLGVGLAVFGIGLGIFGLVGGIFSLYAVYAYKLPLSLPPLPVLIGQGPLAMMFFCSCSFWCFKEANRLASENISPVTPPEQNELIEEEAEPLLPIVRNFPNPLTVHKKNKSSEALVIQDDETPIPTNYLHKI